MKTLSKCVLVFVAALFMLSCSQKQKPSMSGDEVVKTDDFLDFFEPLKPPFQFSDSILQAKSNDSLLISYKVFTGIVPDSVLQSVFGKGVKPKIYPLGKVVVPKAETYIFLKAISAADKAFLVIVFDKKKQYMTALPAMKLDQNNNTTQALQVDRSIGITQSITRKNSNGTISEGKNVYILSESNKKFILAMTDALDEKPVELLNPIDTLPRKHKYSADYGTGKTNLVSIRDGRKNDRITFFIHFERDNGACIGELKGEALLKNGNTAEYKEGGDPCVLHFTFNTGSVLLKEESCGARRGLQCLFDGSYIRIKEHKPSKPNKKK